MTDFLSDIKPVAYVSKSASDEDTHYAYIEKELLGENGILQESQEVHAQVHKGQYYPS